MILGINCIRINNKYNLGKLIFNRNWLFLYLMINDLIYIKIVIYIIYKMDKISNKLLNEMIFKWIYNKIRNYFNKIDKYNIKIKN